MMIPEIEAACYAEDRPPSRDEWRHIVLALDSMAAALAVLADCQGTLEMQEFTTGIRDKAETAAAAIDEAAAILGNAL